MDAIVFEENVSRASPRPQKCGVSEKLWMASLEQLLYLVTWFKIIYIQVGFWTQVPSLRVKQIRTISRTHLTLMWNYMCPKQPLTAT